MDAVKALLLCQLFFNEWGLVALLTPPDRGDACFTRQNKFGGRMLRVRGDTEIVAHLMVGTLVLTADQILCLVM